jgi:drug/metabolite transporter (DMT)-like permease
MTGPVFVVVLTAAVLHASWNAIAKAIPDPRVSAGMIGGIGPLVGTVGVLLLPSPALASWPFIAASSVLQTGYLLLLVHAYRYGEFSRVYPLARGLPPLLVTLVALAVLGEELTGGQLAGVVLISVALTALVFAGGRPRSGSGLGLAAATGLLIAAYTLVDGVGVRQSGHALSYISWMFLVTGALMLAVCRLMYGPGYGRAMARSARRGVLAGGLAAAAYGAVVWAQGHAPLALVSALRETSLLLAGVIGTLVFGERFSLVRLAATATAVAGIVLLQAT